MSLLSIVKSVMDSNGWPDVVLSVSGNATDANMRQAFSLANKTLKEVSFKKNWPVLVREHQFTTVAGQVEYPLPEDFHHLVSPSAVNAGQYYQMKGALTPIQWYRMALKGTINWASGFRIDPHGRTFNVAPAPAGGSDVVFMYITNLIATNSSGATGRKQYTADTDVALVDEEVIEQELSWRWRQKKGLDYTAELAEAQATLKTRFAQEYGLGDISVGATRSGEFYDQYPLTPGYIGPGPIGP